MAATGASVGGGKFNDTIFAPVVLFTGKPKEQWAMDFAKVTGMNTEDLAKLKKRHEDSWAGIGSGPDRFLRISFAGNDAGLKRDERLIIDFCSGMVYTATVIILGPEGVPYD